MFGSEALAPLRENPSRAAILLDIDGTLAPIASQPADAIVPERTRQVLIEVARRYGYVACVSGRRASEARAMVSIGTITYLGSHGAEVLRPGWTEAKLDPEIGKFSWRRFRYRWTPSGPGTARIMARATNAAGQTQETSQWNRSGYARDVIEHVDVNVA